MTDFVREIVSAFVRSAAAPLSPEEIEYARATGIELPPPSDLDPDDPETVIRAFAWAAACFARGYNPLAPEHTPTLN
jgi:hypothetical protein